MQTRRNGGEQIPLLQTGGEKQRGASQLVIQRERELWENEDAEEEARDQQLFAENMNRGASLLFQDTLILVLQMLQLFCVAMSLGLRWVWPYRWVKNTYFIFIANFDIWDFLKVQKGLHEDVQNHHIASEDMPINYWLVLLMWGVVLFVGFLVYVLIYAVIHYKHDVLMLSQVAKLQWVYLVLLQCLAVPFGVATGRVFHCNDKKEVDVDNELKCYSDHHWAYIVPVVALWILYYVLLTVWLAYKTRTELLSMPSKRHEAYLQLKEIEFVHGLDTDWMIGHFHILSSFKKWGAYYRAAAHALIGVVVLLVALMYKKENALAILLTCVFFLVFLTSCIIRPYRVAVFNWCLCWSLFCIFGAFLTGAFVSSFDTETVHSVYLTEKYLTYILVVVAVVFFVVGLVAPVLYILIRHNQRACCPCCLRKYSVKAAQGLEWRRDWEPLWPALSSSTLHKLSPETRKFVKAILRGRVISEKIVLMPPLFAPAHELARHIHVINAYCREAEYLQDPMQSTLWDLLDELIDAHERVAPKSLFAESVKASIQKTATEFVQMMPAFTRRLAQREYDFLLMRPVKRRMLLKMYCMGLFLNNRREKAMRQRLTVPHLEKVWRKTGPVREDDLQDDGYYEDMYPAVSDEPSTYRPETAIALDLLGLHEEADTADDDHVLREAETFTQQHPMSPLPAALSAPQHMYTNLVFTDDLSDTSSVATTARSREHTATGGASIFSVNSKHDAAARPEQSASHQHSALASQASLHSRQYSPLASQASLRSHYSSTSDTLQAQQPDAQDPAVNKPTRETQQHESHSSLSSHSFHDVVSFAGSLEKQDDVEPDEVVPFPEAGPPSFDSVVAARPPSGYRPGSRVGGQRPGNSGGGGPRPGSGASGARVLSPAPLGSTLSLRSGSRPSSAQQSLGAEVMGSKTSLQSAQSQVHVAGQEEDPPDMPTEYAV